MPAPEQLQNVERSPVDASMKAALQLEELKQGLRADAPALKSATDLIV